MPVNINRFRSVFVRLAQNIAALATLQIRKRILVYNPDREDKVQSQRLEIIRNVNYSKSFTNFRLQSISFTNFPSKIY